jgi:uncharacterized protein YyaL (SSP411 family)
MTANEPKGNRLVNSTSPYLRQHAYNPVDWYEWGPEALDRAVKEDKPILVSIGYSSCHWCHVMERESFENKEVAALMNQYLVCIKVDREERPDIDHVYMEAVQAMGLNGGWPLNVFLTPDQKPFYGGTYFPPTNWTALITHLANAFRDRRVEIDKTGDDLAKHLNTDEVQRFAAEPGTYLPEDLVKPFDILASKFDNTYAGLDRAPKFIMPGIWQWLLRHHHQTKSALPLDMVWRTLEAIARGGIYDHVGGGFARYSVDNRWFAPHFEKMLYDNAQLLSLYSEAYRLRPHPWARQVILDTAGWLNREMRHPEGGFYSALDADSEGEEGRYYTWTTLELNDLLGEAAPLFARYYGVTSKGNWEEGRNIIYRPEANPPSGPDAKLLQECLAKLLAARGTRVRPGLDDKILTGWNAMLIVGLTDAYKSLGDDSLLLAALQCASFLRKNLIEMPRCYRSFKERRGNSAGFLEDYAHLVRAWIALYECTFDESWIREAQLFTEHVMGEFRDDSDGFFYFSSASGEKLIARKKELFDNVIPSANSVMARNLFRLGTILDREDWKRAAIGMTTTLKKLILSEPNYMFNWGMLAQEKANSFHEVVISGPQAPARRLEISSYFLPFVQILGAEGSSTLPLLEGRFIPGYTRIYVCSNKVCKLPIETVNEALRQLSSAT